MARELTGKHVLAITCTAFGIIIAVNVTMAWNAVSTFPGLEVANSYVASQNFNERKAEQEALGWKMTTRHEGDRVLIGFSDAAGQPVQVANLNVLIGRRTSSAEDQRPEFIWLGGIYEAALPLGPGYWTLRVSARAQDGTLFEQRSGLRVEGL